MGESLSNEQKEKYIQRLTDALAMLRAKANITQEDLANLIGISRQTYSLLESKKKPMSWSTYLSLLFVYNSMLETSSIIRKLEIRPEKLMEQLNNPKEVDQ